MLHVRSSKWLLGGVIKERSLPFLGNVLVNCAKPLCQSPRRFGHIAQLSLPSEALVLGLLLFWKFQFNQIGYQLWELESQFKGAALLRRCQGPE